MKQRATTVIGRVLKALGLNVLSWLAFLLVVIALYFGFIRDLQMTWGADSDDIARPMLGDELLPDPDMNATRAVVIDAPPEQIWPWITQIGYNRGGFYGFDNLDNGGLLSSDTLLPEYGNTKVGDSIPGGEWKGQVFYLLEVVAVDTGQAVAWKFIEGTPWGGGTWSWGLYPIDSGRTKLVTRLRQKYRMDSFQGVVSWSMIDAIEILMMRTTLRGIKLRAERTALATTNP